MLLTDQIVNKYFLWFFNIIILHSKLPVSVLVRIMITLQEIPVLSSKTCGYVTLHGKRQFAVVITDRDLEMGILSWVTGVGPI